MKYILFDESAVEYFVTNSECQSTDYIKGKELIEIILGNSSECNAFKEINIVKTDQGLLFIGRTKSTKILVIDLTRCKLLDVERNYPENILVVLQKTFRASMRFWNHLPFINAERVNNSKLVVFPFPYNYNNNDNKRIVLEREPKSRRLEKRGIKSPILAYKYSGETVMPGSKEVVDVNVLDDAGEYYISIRNTIGNYSKPNEIIQEGNSGFDDISISTTVGNEGFKYLTYNVQYSKLTINQKKVVDCNNNNLPLRITGAAGTGKTTSMLLRAYKLLLNAKDQNKAFKIIFFAHSESTKFELIEAFKLLDTQNEFLDSENDQTIEFITLFAFCKRFRNIKDIQVLDDDATDAKEYQLMLIENALEEIMDHDYKTYKLYLSQELRTLIENTSKYILCVMLQHEFSIQIKGRADGVFENYCELTSLKNGLPLVELKSDLLSKEGQCKDKEFIYKIYQQYQKSLETSAVYDVDDIVIEALLGLNAPIWRRKRATSGYDYIFVDEMHLFNLNEQNTFHYLTKDIDQKKIPICFAIDYSQTIGDRGDLTDSYIERELSNDYAVEYNTVFRSAPQIVELCASIIASGALIFQATFRNPYKSTPQNSSTYNEMSDFYMPELIMYNDERNMISGLKELCDQTVKKLQCKNHKIAIITFDEDYLTEEKSQLISSVIGRKIYVLNGRNYSSVNDEVKKNDSIILTSPYNINGLEFDAVILLGIDGKRVPATEGVADIGKNFLKYKAYNMLYLAVSRAKYKVYMIGNQQNGESECIKHSVASGTIKLTEL